MSEELTKDLNGKKSFEERVFARFDRMDLRFEKLEARSYDTKPIWEKALKAIMDTGKEVGEIKNRVAVIETAIAGLSADVGTLKTDVGTLKTDMGTLKTDMGTLKTDVGVLKTDVAELTTDHRSVRNELVDVRRELRENVREQLALMLKFLLEDRSDIRDAEDRIRKLETRLA
jgi:chromosome segregation ATPase